MYNTLFFIKQIHTNSILNICENIQVMGREIWENIIYLYIVKNYQNALKVQLITPYIITHMFDINRINYVLVFFTTL